MDLKDNPVLDNIRKYTEQAARTTFNSCLVNLYRDENDYVPFHADDETLFEGRHPISSISFGETRRFLMRFKSKYK